MIKLAEIAKLAGVSTATASLALHDKPGVSSSTKLLIKQIADEQGYLPLRIHQPKYKGVVRLIIASKSSKIDKQYKAYPFITNLISAIQQKFHEANYKVLITSIEPQKFVTKLIELETMQSTNYNLIMSTGLSEFEIKSIYPHFDNLIFIDTTYHNLPISSISTNNYLGGYIAAKYLTDNGHRNIGYISGAKQIHNFEHRLHGFKRGLSEFANTSLNKDFLLTSENMQLQETIDNFKILSRKQLPTAFFCENDMIATSFITYLQQIGLRVPKDISVIGFDGLSRFKEYDSNITSVAYSIQSMSSNILNACLTNNNNFQLVINPYITDHGTVKLH